MNPEFQARMAEASRLTRQGRLTEATELIRRALGPVSAATRDGIHPTAPGMNADPQVIDLELGEVHAAPTAARPSDSDDVFLSGRHSEPAGARDFKLYVPPGDPAQPRPLLVLLHGCTQDPDDFAAGTRMNALAREQGLLVLYPAQSADLNPQRCWNWFKPSHQGRSRGEPAVIAGMVRRVMAERAVDPRRVFAAGLSAGGAMAAILGRTHPELFAAVGVHSGLAAGSARDLPSALAAMRGPPAIRGEAAAGPPVIVFHGDADTTVHPGNADAVVRAAAGPDCAVSTERRTGPSRSATVRRFIAPSGRIQAEQWTVHGGGHAWSGGVSPGSFVDPGGPDASVEMLRFFATQSELRGERAS